MRNLTRDLRPASMLSALKAASAAVLLASPLAAQSRIPLAFRDSVPAWLAANRVPGAVVAILDEGKVTCTYAFGELRPGVPMTTRALFNVASLTKPVVALTTLRLASTHTLDLDAPLDADWIDPDIKDDPRHAKLTARIILSHQTGFPNWRSSSPDHKLGFLFDPGTKFGYSGEGFEYLRRALEHRYARSMQQLSDSILFEPLHMSETTFGWNPAMDKSRFAVGHDTSGRAIEEELRPMNRANAADWLVTTIGDYSRFAEFVLSGATLPPALYADMLTPQVRFDGKPNEAMGLGWEIMTGPPDDPKIVMHTAPTTESRR